MSKSLIVITYNREEPLKNLLQSIDTSSFDKVVIVHDGGASDYSENVVNILQSKFIYLKQTENIGVGRCKQIGIDWVLENTDSEHIFILEDDIVILNNSVWDYYIRFSKNSGIWHTNWNDVKYKSIKYELDYNGIEGIINRDCSGVFSYFNRNVFKFCKYPSDMKNALDVYSVELQLIEKHLLPPFWNFVCPKNTEKYVKDLNLDSNITDRNDYTPNFQEALKVFVSRHGIPPFSIKDSPIEKVEEMLKFLKTNYSKLD